MLTFGLHPGEAGVPFFYRSGSEFEELYVGVGSRRMRTLFATAKKKVSERWRASSGHADANGHDTLRRTRAMSSGHAVRVSKSAAIS